MATSLKDDLKRKFNEAMEAKRPYIQRWQRNCAFVQGWQWLQTNGRILQPVVKKDNRMRLVDNILMPYVRTVHAKFLSYSPTWETVPGSNEENDITNAKTCDKLLEYLYWRCFQRSEMGKAVLWAIITGNAYLQAIWDSDSKYGPKIPDIQEMMNPDGMPQLDEMGQPIEQPSGKMISKGEVGLLACSGYEITPQPGCMEHENIDWLFKHSRMPVDSIYNRWGVEVQGKAEEIEERLFEPSLSGDSKIIEKNSENTAVVVEYWEKSTRRHPNGLLRIYTQGDDKVLWEGDNPDPQRELPFYQIKNVETPGKYYANSVIEQAISTQKTRNQVLSQIVEGAQATNNAKWFNVRGNGVKTEELNNMFNTVITYNPGMIPSRETPHQLPPQYFQILDMESKIFENLSGQHEQSKGLTPSGVRSGLQMSYLLEQDESQLKPFFTSIEDALRKVGIKTLQLCQEHYDEERLLRMLGTEKKYQTIVFKREFIADEIDVRVRITSALPQSPTARRDLVLLLKQNGLVNDPNQALKMMELGTKEALYDDFEQDRSFAEFENDQMKQGIMRVPRDFDNHIIHGQILNKYRKTLEFDALGEQTKSMFNTHAQMHIEMMAVLMGGAPPGAGPSQPPPPTNGINAPIESASNNEPIQPEGVNDLQGQ